MTDSLVGPSPTPECAALASTFQTYLFLYLSGNTLGLSIGTPTFLLCICYLKDNPNDRLAFRWMIALLALLTLVTWAVTFGDTMISFASGFGDFARLTHVSIPYSVLLCGSALQGSVVQSFYAYRCVGLILACCWLGV